MSSLNELLGSPEKRDNVIDDCCGLVDAEVADKGGLSGLAIKAGYGAVKGVKPGFIRHVVGDLLPEFASALDPIYQDAKSQGKAASEIFKQNPSRVADALLAITDAKAEKAKGIVKGTYEKLRGSAKKNVEAAVPRLASLVDKYASS